VSTLKVLRPWPTTPRIGSSAPPQPPVTLVEGLVLVDFFMAILGIDVVAVRDRFAAVADIGLLKMLALYPPFTPVA